MEPLWDIEIDMDTPATIAVLGAGPTGIETALYARFLGYDVVLVEQTKPASAAIAWADRSLGAPLRELISSLGIRALEAQGHNLTCLDDTADATGAQWATSYLTPLAKSDLIADCVLPFTRVVDVGRWQTHKYDSVDSQSRCNDEFRLLLHSDKRGSWVAPVDVVIDCTGKSPRRSGLGPNGMQAAFTEAVIPNRETESVEQGMDGPPVILDPSTVERTVRQQRLIESELPRWRDKDQSRYVGKTVCLSGDSPQALVAASDWLDMAEPMRESKLIWLVPDRSENPEFDTHSSVIADLARRLSSQNFAFGLMPIRGIERIKHHPPTQPPTAEHPLTLSLRRSDQTTVDLRCDQLVSLPVAEPNFDFCQSLRVIQDTSSCKWPMRVLPPESFETAEPHYYVVGSKSTPSHCVATLHPEDTVEPEAPVGGFLDIATSLQATRSQIRQLFALLGHRMDLNLYA
jgi:hypothetical protein